MNRHILTATFGFGAALLLSGTTFGTTLPSVGSGTLKLHLDASTGVTTEAGNRVTQWDDQSAGGANDFTAPTLGARRPTLIGAGLNGLPTLRFDGTGNWMSVAGGHNLTSAASTLDDDFTMFVVRAGTGNPLGMFDSATGAQNPFRFFNSNAVELWPNNPAIGFTVVPGGSVLAVRGSRAMPTNRFLDVRDTSAGQGFAGSAGGTISTAIAWTNPVIGSINSGGAGHYQGDISEIVLYEGYLSDTDRNAVSIALANQYLPKAPDAITLSDFFGAGQDLDAEIVGFRSEHSGGLLATNAFDGNASTAWATANATGDLLTLDLDLTPGAPGGVLIDGMTWQNRANSLDWVHTMEVIFSTDAIFGNGDDVTTGPLDVDGADADTHAFGSPFFAKYVRFHALTTTAGFNPGAFEAGLTGSVIPEPSTLLLASLGFLGMLGWGRRGRRHAHG